MAWRWLLLMAASASAQIGAEVDRYGPATEALAVCPDRLMSAPRALSTTGCWDRAECWAECQAGNGAACFALALGLEADHAADPGLPPRHLALYALSCATDGRLGCSLRADGLLRALPGDPLAAWPRDRRRTCAARTQSAACGAGAAYACARAAILAGKPGSPEYDAAAAQGFAARACDLSFPQAEECRLARALLAAID